MNPALAAIEPSLIRTLNAKKRASSIDLGLGEPTLAPEASHFEAALRWVNAHGCAYTPNAGASDLRAAIARHYGYPGLENAENVCVTAGSEEAVYLALTALLDPSEDELLVVEPVYPVYAKIASLIGVTASAVPMSAQTGFAFDVARIAAALGPRTRMIVICSPCNPTGRVIGLQQAQTLAAILRAHAQRFGKTMYVLHDEVYRELTFVEDGAAFADVYQPTIVVNSLSKSNALTGLRVGWVAAPLAELNAIVKLHALVTTCASTFSQRVAAEMFARSGLAEHVPWYRSRRADILAVLEAGGLEFLAPDGAFYTCVRVPGCTDSAAFAHHLIDERDVVAIPGVTFGTSLEGWLRLSWVAPVDVFREGLARIADAAAAGIGGRA